MDTKNDNVQELQNEQVDATTKPVKAKKEKSESKVTKKKDTTKKTNQSTTKGSKSTRKVKLKDTLSDPLNDMEKTEKKVKVADKAKRTSEKKKPTTKNNEDKKQDSEKIEEIEIKDVEPIQSNIESIKQFKLFFVSDMDEEASYLHEMSLKGLHFERKKGMQYFFKQGEATNYFYHLGYNEKDKHDSERYLDNYADAGWDNIYHEKAEFDGVWNYFRIKMPEGVCEPNIFSDRSSRLSLYKRLLSAWRSLLALDVICFLCMIFVYIFLSSHPGKLTGTVMSICTILIVLIIMIFVIYLRAYLKISKKQNELQNV